MWQGHGRGCSRTGASKATRLLRRRLRTEDLVEYLFVSLRLQTSEI